MDKLLRWHRTVTGVIDLVIVLVVVILLAQWISLMFETVALGPMTFVVAAGGFVGFVTIAARTLSATAAIAAAVVALTITWFAVRSAERRRCRRRTWLKDSAFGPGLFIEHLHALPGVEKLKAARQRQEKARRHLDRIMASDAEPTPQDVDMVLRDRVTTGRIRQLATFTVSAVAGACVDPLFSLL